MSPKVLFRCEFIISFPLKFSIISTDLEISTVWAKRWKTLENSSWILWDTYVKKVDFWCDCDEKPEKLAKLWDLTRYKQFICTLISLWFLVCSTCCQNMALAINYSISKSKYHQRQRSDTVSYVDEFVTSKNQVINAKERQSVHSVKTQTLLMSFKYLKIDLFKAAQSKVFSFRPNKTNLPINLLIHYTTTYVHQKKIIKMRIIISYHRLYQLSQPYRS